MNTCIACSMPLNEAKDIGAETADGPVCIHCVNEKGEIRSCAEIYEGGVQFFMSAVPGTDRALSEKLVRKNMKSLAYWQKHPDACLSGEEATEAEFMAAMSKLG